MVRNPFSGQSRGFAFVGMSSTDEAERVSAQGGGHNGWWEGSSFQAQ